MKRFISLKLTAFLLITGLYSCNNSDPAFTIYVGQTSVCAVIDQYGGYIPYVGFAVGNGNLKKGQISKDGYPLLVASYMQDYCEVTGERGESLSDLNGTYQMIAQSDTEEQDSFTFTFNFTKEPGDLNFEDFVYSDGKISFKVPKAVENTNFYGVCVDYINGTNTDKSIFNKQFYSYNATTTTNLTVQFDLDSSTITADKIIVYPFAAETSSGYILFKLDEPKTLYPGDKSFSEDMGSGGE